MFSLIPRRRETALARRLARPFELLDREFASLFEEPWPFEAMTRWEPWTFETEERENEVVLRTELPGFEPTELEVTLAGNALTVRAEHREAVKEPAAGEASERTVARVERTVALPTGIDPAKVEASYRNGVLEVHVPRTPGATPRRIEVKT